MFGTKETLGSGGCVVLRGLLLGHDGLLLRYHGLLDGLLHQGLLHHHGRLRLLELLELLLGHHLLGLVLVDLKLLRGHILDYILNLLLLLRWHGRVLGKLLCHNL